MRIVVSLLKASVIATLVFALSWIRFPDFALSLRTAAGVFFAFGIPIVFMALMIHLQDAWSEAHLGICSHMEHGAERSLAKSQTLF
jgi:hypothetical protein